jgi:hypothetical protein
MWDPAVFREPPVVAASIAAIIAGINIIVTVWLSRRQMALQYAIKNRELRAADVAAGRQALRDLARLAERLKVSAKRLVDHAESLEDNDMMEQAATTLSIVAEFFNTTNQDSLVMVPDEIVPSVKAIRKDLTALLLELQMKRAERTNAKTRLAGPYSALSGDIRHLQELISKFVNPFSDSSG